MKAIILAAGMGSRLDDSPCHLPKALAMVNQQTSILEFQIRSLTTFLSLNQIWIVVGYNKEAIMDAFSDLVFIYNPNFRQENTAKSLLRALRKVDEDVLWLNGDVVYRPDILNSLVQGNRTGMIVNQAVVGSEEMKYRTDQRGCIIEISKTASQPKGEALGINFFKQADLIWLRNHLEKCHPHEYFEKGIEMGLHEGHEVWSFPVELDDCIEVDFPEDLARAKQLVHRWTIA